MAYRKEDFHFRDPNNLFTKNLTKSIIRMFLRLLTLLKLICNADITLQWIFPSFSHSDSWIHHWSHKFRTVSLKLFGIHLKKCNLFVITHGTKSFWFIPVTGMILHHKMIKLIFLGLNTHWPVFYAF